MGSLGQDAILSRAPRFCGRARFDKGSADRQVLFWSGLLIFVGFPKQHLFMLFGERQALAT